MLRRFLFKIFCLAWLVALLTTGAFWIRSYSASDEWLGWKEYGSSGVVHFVVQSYGGRVQLYGERVERLDSYNRPIAFPLAMLPDYPPTSYRSMRTPEWDYADAFRPTPQPNHDFNWAYETRSEPVYEEKQDYYSKASSSQRPSVTRREYRWLFAFPYGALAAVFAIPLAWTVLARAAGKAARVPAASPAASR